MWRYMTASESTSGEGPKAASSGFPATSRTRADAAPTSSASQQASIPREIASRVRPAPKERATAAVVEYARKIARPTTVVSTVEASPSPASDVVETRAMKLESTRMNIGSATSAPRLGIARRRMSRSTARRAPSSRGAGEEVIGGYDLRHQR